MVVWPGGSADRGSWMLCMFSARPAYHGESPNKFIAREQFPIFDGSQEYCLWLGCMGAYDPAGREIVTAFARVMDHLGTSYGVLRKERCTGDPARRLGNDLLFEQLATWNMEALAEGNVAKIVSICPHCVRTISTDWKQHAQIGRASCR